MRCARSGRPSGRRHRSSSSGRRSRPGRMKCTSRLFATSIGESATSCSPPSRRRAFGSRDRLRRSTSGSTSAGLPSPISPSTVSSTASLCAPGGLFGPAGEGYVRFALVPTQAECERAAEIIRSAVSDAEAVVAALDRGEVRVAEPDGDEWRVNGDGRRRSSTTSACARWSRVRSAPSSTATRSRSSRVRGARRRVVPPATARFGAYLSPGVVLMPST